MVPAVSRRLDLSIAVLIWSVGFLWVSVSGSWALLAGLAVAAALRLLVGDPLTRRLLTPTLWAIGVGVVGAAIMIIGTYASYFLLSRLIPPLVDATADLYRLLRADAYGQLRLAALITLVSASEEIVWRGRLLESPGDVEPAAWPTRAQALRVVGAATVYALAHIASRSITLAIVAFICGIAWGLLRVAMRSLWASILTHALWDLAILVFWPLA